MPHNGYCSVLPGNIINNHYRGDNAMTQKLKKRVRIYSEFAAEVFLMLGFEVTESNDGSCFFVYYDAMH